MKLTKHQAVEEHRKMWKWIACQLENGVKKSVFDLKIEYCKQNNFDLCNHCFCCEYRENVKEDCGTHCKLCPVLWGSENVRDFYFCEQHRSTVTWSKANRLTHEGKYKKAAEIARQIANLPERPDNEYDILEESDNNGKETNM